jgi:FkbM family methyltransferase
MSVSEKCIGALIGLYEGANRIGLMNSRLVQSLYVSTYFTYKKHLEDPYARLSKYHSDLFKGGHILDIGANIGYTAFVFSKVLEERFNLFAFEPEKRNIDILKQVSHKYRFSSRLIPVASAVGDTEGEIELWQNEGNSADHRILTEELKKQLQGQIKTQKTALVSIDSYLKKCGNTSPISFIKIDVQGYELAVCQGMIETLKHNPNAVIGLEYCPDIIEALGFHPQGLLQFFRERDYHFYFLNPKNEIEACDVENHFSSRKVKRNDYIEILCAHRNLASSQPDGINR